MSPPLTQKTVLAFGELLWDLLPSGAVLGGAVANFAYRITSLGDRGLLVSSLGRDALGRAAADQLLALGMDTSHLQWTDAFPTGTVQVQLDAGGNPDFHIVPGVAYDAIESTDLLLNLAAQADCLCFGTLVQRAAQSRRTLAEVLAAAPQALKFLDINLRKSCYTAETIAESLQQADILKLNEDEARYLATLFGLPTQPLDQFAQATLSKWELQHCLITLGERGALVATETGEIAYSPGYEVDLADTVGSGDACSAGFVHGILGGQSPSKSLDFGNVLGALVATQHGATEPIPSQRVIDFMASPPSRRIEPGLESWRVRAESF